MRSTVFPLKALACLASLGILTYGTRGLASHQHLHIAYVALTTIGVVSGALFTGTWSLKA
ncbi:hypothetical protein BDI24065_06110 [Burkholderia diffusa]|uniref:Uncharacterized protein n=1 Tax=Burkholderia diffusa TaxID=488732 RepID=A0A6P2QZ90_9BURK|nr:hypothetical protein BDI24065_06110 [Burkholderia diffusa]